MSCLITQLALFDPDKLRLQGMFTIAFFQSWMEITCTWRSSESDLHLSLGGPMHHRFLCVLYQPVNVGPYSEDSLSVLCSGRRLYLWYNGKQPHWSNLLRTNFISKTPHYLISLFWTFSSFSKMSGLLFTYFSEFSAWCKLICSNMFYKHKRYV
jgi:hypothetical protein